MYHNKQYFKVILLLGLYGVNYLLLLCCLIEHLCSRLSLDFLARAGFEFHNRCSDRLLKNCNLCIKASLAIFNYGY